MAVLVVSSLARPHSSEAARVWFSVLALMVSGKGAKGWVTDPSSGGAAASSPDGWAQSRAGKSVRLKAAKNRNSGQYPKGRRLCLRILIIGEEEYCCLVIFPAGRP